MWIVKNPARKIVAKCEEPEAACILVSFYGEGSMIAKGKVILWMEGDRWDGRADQSYDRTINQMESRLEWFQRS